MNQVTGGKTVYGAAVGFLMLETKFPRLPGDVANALTWPFPVQYRVVPSLTLDGIIRQDPRNHIDDFIREARALIDMGCDGISTNCGFLTLLQKDLKEALGVPVATSSLLQAPMIQATLPPNKQIGILTISKPDLTDAHLKAAGVSLDTPVEGTEGGQEFSRVILNNQPRLDYAKARIDLLEAAARLAKRNPNLGAIILECTNMAPFAADIRKLTGLPVYSIYSLITWFQAGLTPRRFPLDLDDPRLDLATNKA